ncbi:hypothetical protein GCM10010300_09610 [Streptomyces olivaceoviridis]|uniref:hypothetical protein n=1 Tax=Streptomyces olivaceoviridis TaxID=1921 RepID=UPI0016760329|nr:hypothetical protein [Streptomyces olivaceoviridis]GGY68612.1 hypothetical protein GCM10010300_09610 [Streptomyces olivaceoviridis]
MRTHLCLERVGEDGRPIVSTRLRAILQTAPPVEAEAEAALRFGAEERVPCHDMAARLGAADQCPSDRTGAERAENRHPSE